MCLEPYSVDWWDYRVFNDGRIFNQFGRELGGYLKGKKNHKYRYVTLTHPTTKNKKKFYVHRLVALCFVNNPRPDIFDQVDHISGVTSNNHHTNLRWLNHHLNSIHRTKAKGCYYVKRWKKWEARLGTKEGRKHIGYFKTYEEAHAAYLKARRKHFITTYIKYLNAPRPEYDFGCVSRSEDELSAGWTGCSYSRHRGHGEHWKKDICVFDFLSKISYKKEKCQTRGIVKLWSTTGKIKRQV